MDNIPSERSESRDLSSKYLLALETFILTPIFVSVIL